MPGYGSTARLMHWITVLLVLSTIPAGTIMVQEDITRSLQDRLFIYHKNIGLIILLLVLIRLVWRALNPPPPLPDSVPVLQQRVATATHWALYAMLIFMPVTGYVRVVTGGFPIEMLDWLGVPPLLSRNETVENIAMSLHYYGRYVLIVLILMHVGGALYHGLIRRDGVFGRMWPPLARRME
jgi:cytochrome b561